ncbi:MAG: glycosyltransferase family 39 protein [bacterium]
MWKFLQKEKNYLLFIFILSLSIRLIYLFFHNKINHLEITSLDIDGYHTLALNLLKKHGFCFIAGEPTSYRPFLYPAFLSSIYFIFGQSKFIVQFIQTILGSFTVIFTYLIANKFLNKKKSLISSYLYAIYPLAIFLNACFLTETLFIFLFTLFILFLLNLDNTQKLKEVISGIILGLAILTRPVFLYFHFFILFWFIKKFSLVKGFYKWGIILFLAILVNSPWIIRNYFVHHNLVLGTTNGGITFWGGNNKWCLDGKWVSPNNTLWKENNILKKKIDALTEVEKDKFYYQLGFNWIKNNPKKFVFLEFKKFLRFWDYDKRSYHSKTSNLYKIIGLFSYGILLPFIIIGFCFSLKNNNFLILNFSILYFLFITLIFYGDIRLRAPIEPFLFILGSIGISKVIKWIKLKLL